MRAPAESPPPVAGLRPAMRYRANDFSISRQRSWGTPIPIVYCEGDCGAVPVPEEQLPVLLPLDLTPTGAGNPLAEREDFVRTTCPALRRSRPARDRHAGLSLRRFVAVGARLRAPAERERPLDEIFALEDLRTWLPCERVVAGSDSGNFVFDQRIVTKALRDIGPLAFLTDGEPFAGCLFHEMVIRDGRKMSKHLGNVVDPDELVARYGADTVRLATLYAARPQRALNWSDSAVLRCHRFLTQVWDFSQAQLAATTTVQSGGGSAVRRGGSRPETRPSICGCKLAQVEREGRPEDHRGDASSLEMHSAVRDVMRLFDRIKDYRETCPRAQRGAGRGQPRRAAGRPDGARADARAVRAAHRRGAVDRAR